jgi:uncharacterized protein (DUF1778 family)
LRQSGSELGVEAALRCLYVHERAPAGALEVVSTGRGRDPDSRGGAAVTGPRRRRRASTRADRRLVLRLTAVEHAAIAAAAARVPGRPVTLARFVAEAALTAAGPLPADRQVRAPSRLALAELMEAVTAVNRIGNNLNQLAREKNVTGLRPASTRDAEQRAIAALNRLAEVAERLADGAA